jgi:hypothetical protein
LRLEKVMKRAGQLADHCHILETGNGSFRFKASAATPKTRKEKLPVLPPADNAGNTFNQGHFSMEIPGQVSAQINVAAAP